MEKALYDAIETVLNNCCPSARGPFEYLETKKH